MREVRLASSSPETRGLAQALSELLDLSGPLGVRALNATGVGRVVLSEIVTNTNQTLLEKGEITLVFSDPGVIVELNPIVAETGELQGAWLGLGVEGSSVTLLANLTGEDTIAGTHSYYLLELEEPLLIRGGNLTVWVEQAALYPSLEGINETRGPARPVGGGVELFNGYLVVTRGRLDYGGESFQLPYQVGRGLYLLVLTQRGEAVVLREIIESPLADVLGDLRTLMRAAGAQAGEIALPRNALSGVRLGLSFEISEGGGKWFERAVVRFEANGEAIGIHGLVSDTIIVRRGLSDIYISIQPPMVQGYFDTYHEPLVYYVKEATQRLPPEQALALTSLMAAGYNIGSVRSLDHLQAGFMVEQALLDLLLLARDFEPARSALLEQGLPVMIKVVPGVGLVWLGVALMAASGAVLALVYAARARVAQ